MFFVEEYTFLGPLLLGMVAVTLGLCAIVMGRSMRAKSRVILIVLGALGILLSTPVVWLGLIFALGGLR